MSENVNVLDRTAFKALRGGGMTSMLDRIAAAAGVSDEVAGLARRVLGSKALATAHGGLDHFTGGQVIVPQDDVVACLRKYAEAVQIVSNALEAAALAVESTPGELRPVRLATGMMMTTRHFD